MALASRALSRPDVGLRGTIRTPACEPELLRALGARRARKVRGERRIVGAGELETCIATDFHDHAAGQPGEVRVSASAKNQIELAPPMSSRVPISDET